MGTTTARPRRVHRPKPEPEEPAHAAAPSVSVQYSSGRVTGWVSHLPPSWVPYVQLARLTLPAALILIYLPTLFGVLLAAILARGGGGGDGSNATDGDYHFPNPWWYTCLLLLVSSFFFSNAAHAWDDLADAPIDILIPRTARRPIPRGDVSHLAAFTFVAANAAGAGITLLGFPDPAGTLRYALPNILATAYYPYAKRHTNLPQLVLGFCLAWGVVMGAVAVGCEPFALGDIIRLHPSNTLPHVFSPHLPQQPLSQLPLSPTLTLPLTLPFTTPPLNTTLTLSLPFLSLLTASALWSAIYDTIYAAEDIEADLRLHLGSIAVLCGLRHTKTALWGLLGALAGCLVLCGLSLPATAGWVFYVLAPGGCTAALGAMVWSVDLRDARSTWWWFKYGYWLVGGALVGGLGSEFMRRVG
ncbi:UbiA prenyltransferase family-domain-containing protein [Chaetomium tenue]|uniref:UbiA prenyltransferase family-domain-containing protein n=1 Tax=Chaetomium tenue TaxID=1854479 RepID=A0ACB7NVH4_9PEZI|nr:UbiA prenyltransferase family-domain-containing protein [Chaetomium globosum]